MKITCGRTELLDALSGVSKAVSSKSSIPAIEGILFKCTNYLVMLTAYDLEIGIMTSLSADIEEAGEIVLNARLLIDMIRKIDSDRVTIESSSDLKVIVKGNVSKFNFMGIPAGDFPEMPIPDTDDTLTVSSQKLKDMIGKTIYAVSSSDQKPVHTGTKFVMENTSLTMVSVDGYRLALCKEEDIDFSNEKSFVVPAKTLSEVSKLIGDSDEDVSIGTARRYAVFRLAGYTVVTRLLEGDFLDYRKSIIDGYKTRVKIDVRDLYDAVERASLVINDKAKSPVKFMFDDGKVFVTCTTALGNSYDEIPCQIEGDSVEMG